MEFQAGSLMQEGRGGTPHRQRLFSGQESLPCEGRASTGRVGEGVHLGGLQEAAVAHSLSMSWLPGA